MAAKEKPNKKTILTHSIIAALSIILWLYVDTDAGPDFLYGEYGYYLFGFLCLVVAQFKNRNPVVWFAFGLWFVLASLIVVLILPKLHDKLCPHCREGVAVDASVCPHCAREINIEIKEDYAEK